MSHSVCSFLGDLTSYYNIGRQPTSSWGYGPSYSSGRTHSAPSYWAPFSWGGSSSGRNVTIVGAGDLETMRRHDREDREESRQTTAAVVGAVGTVALAGASAFVWRGYFQNRDALQKAQDFRTNELPCLNPTVAGELTPIVNKHIELLETKCSRSRNIAVLTGGMLVATTAAFIGGMYAMSWLITASIVTSVALGALLVFNIVWNLMDESSLPAGMLQQVHQLHQRYNSSWY